jgi:hypothetical protein
LWDITLAPPARVERAGLKEGMIGVGARVTVHGHPSEHGVSRWEDRTRDWNNKTYNVYPDRQ